MPTIGDRLVCPKCGQEALEHEYRMTDLAGGQRAECAFCGYFYESLSLSGLQCLLNEYEGLPITEEELRNSLARINFNLMGDFALRLGFFPRGEVNPDPSSTAGWRLVNRWFQVPAPTQQDERIKFIWLTPEEQLSFRRADWLGHHGEAENDALEVFEKESHRGVTRPDFFGGRAEADPVADISCELANELFESRSSAPFGQLLLLVVHLLRESIEHRPECCFQLDGARETVLKEMGLPTSEQ